MSTMIVCDVSAILSPNITTTAIANFAISLV